jgi:hypothetical protein
LRVVLDAGMAFGSGCSSLFGSPTPKRFIDASKVVKLRFLFGYHATIRKPRSSGTMA